MPPLSRRTYWLLGLVWVAFLVKTVFYASFLPMWEGYDEYSHFDYVAYLANHRSLPTAQSIGSREVAESLSLVPWPCGHLRPSCVAYAEFWQLPESARQDRVSQLRSLPPVWQHLPSEPPLDLYEAQQPPLAYFFYVFPYRMLAEYPLRTRVWFLRLLAGFIASLTIPLGFAVARQVFRDDSSSLGVVVLAASMPEWFQNVTRISNEPLAAVLATAFVGVLIALIRQQRHAPWLAAALGALLGAALITKGYFITLIPVVVIVYTVSWLRHWESGRRLIVQAAITLSAALALSAWWYVRAYLLTGAFTGQMEDVAAAHSDLSAWQAMLRTDWPKVLDLALVSHIWVGGWSFLVVRTWMYRTIETIILVAIGGVVYRISRASSGDFGRRTLAALALPQFFLWLGLAYHASASFRGYGVSGTLSHYAYCLVITEAACLIVGLRTILPEVSQRWIVPGLVLCMTALEWFGVHIYQLPYYAGLTAHTARGSVPALHFSQLQSGGAVNMFERLSSTYTGFIGRDALIVLWVLYLVAMAGLVAMSLPGSNDKPRL